MHGYKYIYIYTVRWNINTIRLSLCIFTHSILYIYNSMRSKWRCWYIILKWRHGPKCHSIYALCAPVSRARQCGSHNYCIMYTKYTQLSLYRRVFACVYVHAIYAPHHIYDQIHICIIFDGATLCRQNVDWEDGVRACGPPHCCFFLAAYFMLAIWSLCVLCACLHGCVYVCTHIACVCAINARAHLSDSYNSTLYWVYAKKKWHRARSVIVVDVRGIAGARPATAAGLFVELRNVYIYRSPAQMFAHFCVCTIVYYMCHANAEQDDRLLWCEMDIACANTPLDGCVCVCVCGNQSYLSVHCIAMELRAHIWHVIMMAHARF